MEKNYGNTTYGSSLMDKRKHNICRIIKSDSEFNNLVLTGRLKNVEPMSNGWTFASLEKKSHVLDNLIAMGFSIVSYSHWRMVGFYYRLKKYFGSNVRLIRMDTDACQLVFYHVNPEEEILKSVKLREDMIKKYGKK